MNRWYGLLTLAYCSAVFALSSVERPPKELGWIPAGDLLAHGVLYAGLGWLAAKTLRAGDAPLSGWLKWVVPVLFVACYGASDELHQWFVPGRQCTFADWVADVAGGAAVQLVFLVRTRRRRRGVGE